MDSGMQIRVANVYGDLRNKDLRVCAYFCTVRAFRIQTVAAENHSFRLCP